MKLLVDNLRKNFGNKEVLKGVNYTFEEGKIYGLLGRNGAGKTTFFNCLNNDLDIDSGKSLFNNGREEILDPDNIGYVLSTPVVPEFLTGREFLTFLLEINKDNIKDPKTVDEYFELMRIDASDRNKLLRDYSHGMKSKMQMLVYIILNPPVLLLDEPLTSFDVVVAEEMQQLLKQLKKDHIVIFSTHILELALDLCDEIVILNNGVFSKMDKEDLDNKNFKEKIIMALKGDSND